MKISIFLLKKGRLITLTTRDDNGGFGIGRPHPDPTRLVFSIPKLVPFKKLNWAGKGIGGDEKIFKPTPFTFDFCFYF